MTHTECTHCIYTLQNQRSVFFFFYFPINGKDAARGCIVDIGTCSSTGMISSIKISKMVNDKIMKHLGLNSSKKTDNYNLFMLVFACEEEASQKKRGAKYHFIIVCLVRLLCV